MGWTIAPRHGLRQRPLFVFPTLYDPFSNATLEAMARGLPVITSRYNGVSELIHQADNGFVVQDPLDDAAISECMHALTDRGLRRCIGEQAAETASAFTMQRNIQETLDVIHKVSSPRVTADDCPDTTSI